MKHTQAEWEQYAKMDDALDAFASEYVFEVTNCDYSINDVFIDIESNNIAITYDDSCCGCTSSGFINAPLRYLWLDDWQATLRAELEEQERREEQAAALRDSIRKQEKEESDKELYLKLKERFDVS